MTLCLPSPKGPSVPPCRMAKTAAGDILVQVEQSAGTVRDLSVTGVPDWRQYLANLESVFRIKRVPEVGDCWNSKWRFQGLPLDWKVAMLAILSSNEISTCI